MAKTRRSRNSKARGGLAKTAKAAAKKGKTPPRTSAASPPASLTRQAVNQVLDEFEAGRLRSSSGDKVTSRDQAMAIAMSKARRAERESKTGSPSPSAIPVKRRSLS